MIKVKLRDNVYQYEFVAEDGKPSYTVNITVVIDNKRAVIIDTAYSEHSREVRLDLEAQGIKPEFVVFSHYHPDIIGGWEEFKDCTFIGSMYYKKNEKKIIEDKRQTLPMEQAILVNNTYLMQFGSHNLVFVHTPGHSRCSISTIIDDDIIHVGDLVMKTKYGKTILPCICEDGSFEEHIFSLERLLGIKHNIMAFSHGDYAEGQSSIKMHVEDRLFYLRSVKESKGKFKLEQYLKNHASRYDSLLTHDRNILQLQECKIS